MQDEPRIGDLKRNDVAGAVAYARAYFELNGPLPAEEVAVLYRLQDEPAALAAQLRVSPELVERAGPPLRYP